MPDNEIYSGGGNLYFSARDNTLYCEFSDSERFEELYDLRRDPYQLINQASVPGVPEVYLDFFRDRLRGLRECRGASECVFGGQGGASPESAYPELFHSPFDKDNYIFWEGFYRLAVGAAVALLNYIFYHCTAAFMQPVSTESTVKSDSFFSS